MDAQNGGHAAERTASNQMAEVIVNLFQAVEIEQKDSERSAGAVGAFRFIFEDVEQAAIIGEPGERIADGEMADLLEEARVIKKRAAKRESVTANCEDLREHEGCIEKTLGLARCELSGEVHPGGCINGAVKGRFSGIKAAPIPNHGSEKNDSRQELLRARNK